MQPTMSQPPSGPKAGPDLTERLEAWVSEGVIDRSAADAIAAFEAGRRPPPSGVRVTPAAEGLAYLGGALAVAAAGTALGGQWHNLSTAAHIAIPAAIWLALFFVGWRFRDGSTAPLARLSRVLWVLSAAALAWTAGLAFGEGLDLGEQAAFRMTGVATTVYAAALYLVRPSSLQQVAILGGVFVLAIGITQDSRTVTGWVLWSVGIAWIALGWRRILVQPGAAATIGSIVVMLGALFVAADEEAIGAWLAVVSSAGLIGAGVGLRHTAVMVIGTVALFFSTFRTIEQYVEGSTGTALALLVAGVLVSAVAFGVWRLGRGPRVSVEDGATG
jgi:hypothetical protein